LRRLGCAFLAGTADFLSQSLIFDEGKMNPATTQAFAGMAVAAVGCAGMAGYVPSIRDYTYPIVWWGVLAIVDAVNLRFRAHSLWRGQAGRFVGVILPVSVLFWVLFEVLNLAAPQWRYTGGIPSVTAQVIFAFASFSTVVPIIVVFWVLFAGRVCLPGNIGDWAREQKKVLAGVACLLLAIPLVNNVFWFNQGMWLAPALILIPFCPPARCARPARMGLHLMLTGLVAGFFWECINWPSRTHWEYLILPDWPHLFQMPLLGYLGFIPFTLSTLAVYEAQKRIPVRPIIVLLLYGLTFVLLWATTILYARNSLWIPLEQAAENASRGAFDRPRLI
jgi:hypothetical protein